MSLFLGILFGFYITIYVSRQLSSLSDILSSSVSFVAYSKLGLGKFNKPAVCSSSLAICSFKKSSRLPSLRESESLSKISSSLWLKYPLKGLTTLDSTYFQIQSVYRELMRSLFSESSSISLVLRTFPTSRGVYSGVEETIRKLSENIYCSCCLW